MDVRTLSIAYIGNHHDPHCTEGQVARAFERLGHTVERLPVREHDHASIVAAVKASRPDVLLGAKFQFRGADGEWPEAAHAVVKLVDACRPYIGVAICWHWDCVNEHFSPARWQWQQIVSEAVDLTALTDGTAASNLPRCVVVRDGAPSDVDLSFVPERLIDGALFTGTLYGERREWALAMRRQLGRRFHHVGMGGSGVPELGIPANSEVRGAALTRLVRSFKLCAQPSWPRFDGYWSDRITVLSAHGALVVAPTVIGMSCDGWRPRVNYLAAPVSFDEYAERVAEYLDCDQERLEAVRRAGQAHALARPWEVRVSELLRELAKRGPAT